MKIILTLVLLVVIIVLGSLVSPVLAQDSPNSPIATPIIDPDNPPVPPEVPAELPDTAQEALDWVVLALAALYASFVGLVETGIIEFLKKHVSWLDDASKNRISKGAARLLYAVFNVVGGVGVSLALPYVAWLDNTGVWGALVTLIGVIGLPVFAVGAPVSAELWYRLSKSTTS